MDEHALQLDELALKMDELCFSKLCNIMSFAMQMDELALEMDELGKQIIFFEIEWFNKLYLPILITGGSAYTSNKITLNSIICDVFIANIQKYIYTVLVVLKLNSFTINQWNTFKSIIYSPIITRKYTKFKLIYIKNY